MAAANFDDCYTQICALLALEPAPLTPDENGGRAFTITHRGAEVSFIERKHRLGDSVSILVRFDRPPAEKALQILYNLMGASYLMMDDGAAAFVVSPKTNEVFLHRLIPLARIHAPGIQDMLDQFAEQVTRWSRNYFLDSAAPVSNGELSFANLA